MVNFPLTKKQIDYADLIAQRAVESGLYTWSKQPKMTAVMDITYAMKQFDIRLEDMLYADLSDFAHDIIGIQNAIVRDNHPATFDADPLFLPRFANGIREEEKELLNGKTLCHIIKTYLPKNKWSDNETYGTDLLAKLNEITKWCKNHWKFGNQVTTFTDQIDHTTWYTFPFANADRWEEHHCYCGDLQEDLVKQMINEVIRDHKN